MATWNDVRRIALALPGVTEEESRMFGRASASWKVQKKLMVWERPVREWDGEVLAVRTPDLQMKEVLLKSDARIFFTTPHFDGHPSVLIRLESISVKKLKDVIIEAWLSRAPKRAVDAYLKGK